MRVLSPSIHGKNGMRSREWSTVMNATEETGKMSTELLKGLFKSMEATGHLSKSRGTWRSGGRSHME
jgi:hypothetical protein